jgi:hypothetical protein
MLASWPCAVNSLCDKVEFVTDSLRTTSARFVQVLPPSNPCTSVCTINGLVRFHPHDKVEFVTDSLMTTSRLALSR